MYARRPWSPGWLVLLTGVLLLSDGGAVARAAGNRRTPKALVNITICFSLIDQLPPQLNVTAINSIEERRRLATFDAALQDVVREGKLGRSELINNEAGLRSGTGSEKPQPAGTSVTRIFLTQWSQTALGNGADTEILCRFFAETMRDGQRIAKLGPFLGRTRYDVAFAPHYRDNLDAYRAAARDALEQLALSLRVH